MTNLIYIYLITYSIWFFIYNFNTFFNSVQFCLSRPLTAYRTKVHLYVHFRSVNISAATNGIAKKFQF